MEKHFTIRGKEVHIREISVYDMMMLEAQGKDTDLSALIFQSLRPQDREHLQNIPFNNDSTKEIQTLLDAFKEINSIFFQQQTITATMKEQTGASSPTGTVTSSSSPQNNSSQ